MRSLTFVALLVTALAACGRTDRADEKAEPDEAATSASPSPGESIEPVMDDVTLAVEFAAIPDGTWVRLDARLADNAPCELNTDLRLTVRDASGDLVVVDELDGAWSVGVGGVCRMAQDVRLPSAGLYEAVLDGAGEPQTFAFEARRGMPAMSVTLP